MIFCETWHEYYELYFKTFLLNFTSNYMIKADDAHSSSLMPFLWLESLIHIKIKLAAISHFFGCLLQRYFLTV